MTLILCYEPQTLEWYDMSTLSLSSRGSAFGFTKRPHANEDVINRCRTPLESPDNPQETLTLHITIFLYGSLHFTYNFLCQITFQPSILPIQILRIGQLVILGVPGGIVTISHLLVHFIL